MLDQAVPAILLAIAAAYFFSIPPFGQRDLTATSTISLNTSYDYVIIGGGSAGSVLASRLSEREDVSVLLLEAGGHYNENPEAIVPAYFTGMIGTDMDWEFYTEPQENSFLGLNNRRARWPRGKTLGGSSVINFLQFVRGSRFDFDEWEAMGCSGWSYKDVLPYFKKLEDVSIAEIQNSEYRGQGGPIHIIDGRGTALASRFMDAFHEMGIRRLVDFNGEDQAGYGPVQLSIRDGERSSASREYLSGTSKRNNLHIGLRSVVTKVAIDGNKATGVHVIRNAKKMFIRARKEVIVSAGAIKSPQLLMLSGIGPKDQLSKLGIPLMADLPVGENLQDHPVLFMFNNINESISIPERIREGFWSKLNYFLTGGGPFGRTGVEVNAFLHTDPNKANKTYTDIQINMLSTACLPNVFNFKDSVYNTMCDATKEHGFTAIILFNHALSRGSLRLASSDPFDAPLIDPNYFSAPSDVKDYIKGIRLWEQLMQTDEISRLGATTENQRLPICKMHEFRSDAYWECYIRHLAVTGYHPCCTCKMGSQKDPTAVVDSQLRVKGIRNMRVIDASVFPQETSGNLNSPTLMLAEKAADMILKGL